MTHKREHTPESDQHSPTPQNPINRRGFIRSAAMLTVGSLGATAALAQTDSQNGSAAADSGPADTAARLQAQTRRALRWAGERANWVPVRPGVDHAVVIVGSGQSGLGIAHGLRLRGVGGVEVIDQAEPGLAGSWRTFARMRQLRTHKVLPGPDPYNPALSFRAWYETLHGPSAFDALDRAPRLAWADYLDWFQQVTGTAVRYRTRLLEIEPQGDVLRLHLESEGMRRIETTRKLVLANGYLGGGGPNLPDFLRTLPSRVWDHSQSRINFEPLARKVVAVIGAGASAFDAAAVALESGAAEVHLFSRRSYINYTTSSPPQAGYVAASPPRATPSVEQGYPSGPLELAYDLPDVVRWRNYVAREDRISSAPLDAIERAGVFDNFHVHVNASWSDVSLAGNGKVVAKVGGKTMRFDHVLAGTGFRVDLEARPELARIRQFIALWRDRYRPEPGEESAAAAAHPYLGAGYEFLPREGTGAEFLRNIYCFNLAANVSFGREVGNIAGAIDHPRVTAAIARDLFAASVDIAAHERSLDRPQVPPNPAPYERAIRGLPREEVA